MDNRKIISVTFGDFVYESLPEKCDVHITYEDNTTKHDILMAYEIKLKYQKYLTPNDNLRLSEQLLQEKKEDLVFVRSDGRRSVCMQPRLFSVAEPKELQDKSKKSPRCAIL